MRTPFLVFLLVYQFLVLFDADRSTEYPSLLVLLVLDLSCGN